MYYYYYYYYCAKITEKYKKRGVRLFDKYSSVYQVENTNDWHDSTANNVNNLATLYCVLRPTRPPAPTGQRISSSLPTVC